MPALDFNTWARQNNPGAGIADDGGMNAVDLQPMYQNYVNNYNATTGQAETNNPGNPNIYQAPDPFSKVKDAGIWGINQGLGVYSQGPIDKQFGDLTNQSFDMVGNIANQGYTQAGLDGMQGVMGQSNPYANSFADGDTSQFQANNPFMNGFSQFGNAQNQAFDATVDNAMGKVQDRVNSQFGLAGRVASGQRSPGTANGAHVNSSVEAMGNVANQMYSDNFQQNQARALQAQGMGSNAWQNDQTRNLNAFQQGFNNNFNTTNAQSNMWNQDLNRDMSAAAQLPGMQNSQYQGALTTNAMGTQQDEQQFYNDNGGWNNLNNFSSILATLNGTQPADRPKASSTDKILGLLGTASSFLP